MFFCCEKWCRSGDGMEYLNWYPGYWYPKELVYVYITTNIPLKQYWNIILKSHWLRYIIITYNYYHVPWSKYSLSFWIIINYWESLTLWWYDHTPGYCRSSGCFLVVDHDHVPWLGATLLMGWPNNYIIYACGLWKVVKPPCFFDIYRWWSNFPLKNTIFPLENTIFP